VPGLPHKMAAHSGIDSPTAAQKAQGIVDVVPEVFPSSSVPTELGYPLNRSVDSEAKILNNIATKLGDNSSAKSASNLLTERPPCSSCTNTIDLFKEKYPNIELNVIDNAGKLVKPQ
jgi:filamentous hemagglutinin